MSYINFNPNEELFKIVLSYIVPLLLGGIISFLGGLVDFIWKDILRTWRVLVIVGVLILSYFFVPVYSVWLALLALLIFTFIELRSYSTGHNKGAFNVLFTGFYVMSGKNGKFVRSGNAKFLDSKVFNTINDLISDNRIQEFVPIQLLSFKPPRIIYAKDDYETYKARMEKYALNNLGVIWGIIDESGKIKNFQTTINKVNFTGQERAQKSFDEITQVFDVDGISTNIALEFTATALATMWGQCFCDMLNDLGHWQPSLQLAKHSRQKFEQALDQLRKKAGAPADQTVVFERKRILPAYIRQEALAYEANSDETAIPKLLDALLIDPYWFFDGKEDFAEFYNNRYLWDVSNHSTASEHLTKERERFEHRGMVTLPPNFQLFINWIENGAYHSNIQDLEEKIDCWFTSLANEHPNNPFVYLYWADAMRILGRVNLRNDGNDEIDKIEEDNFVVLPVEVLDKMIEKCEKAHDIDPTLVITSVRLGILYMSSAVQFDEDSDEFKRRFDLVSKFSKIGKRFYDEYLPKRKDRA